MSKDLNSFRTKMKKNNTPQLRLQFAQAITSAIIDSEAKQAITLIDELRFITNEHDQPELRLQFAKAIANTVFQVETKQALELINELRTLSSKYEKQDLQFIFANAVRLICTKASYEQAIALIDELHAIANEHNDPDILVQTAQAIVNATFSSSSEQAAILLDKLRAILAKHEEQELRLQFAKAITNVTSNVSNKQATALINELRPILNKHDEPKLRLEFAKTVTNVAMKASYEQGIALLDEMRALSNEQNAELRLEFAKTVTNVTAKASYQQGSALVDELRTISNEHADERKLRSELAKTITNVCSEASYEQAIVLIEELRAISNEPNAPNISLQLTKALYNAGVESYNCNNIDLAHKCFTESKEQAQSIPPDQADDIIYNLQRALQIIEEDSKPQCSNISPSTQAEHSNKEAQKISSRELKDALETIISKCQPEKEALLKKMREREERVNAFLDRSSLFAPDASVLLILRQWNSFTPIISDEAESDRGGGYFIFHKGTGLVIDPGYDFIENFNNAGGRIHDITHIAITHAHDDHTAQLEQLLTMFHQYNSKNKEHEKQITLLLNHSTLKKFSGFSLHKDTPYIKRVICLNAFDDKNIQSIFLNNEKSISLTVLPAYHNDVFSSEYAVGFGITAKFDDEKKHILFTGDTGLYPPLLDEQGKVQTYDIPPYIGEKKVDETPEKAINKRYPEPFNKKPDLLIPHIGSIKKYEVDVDVKVDLDLERHKKKPLYYPNHLGLLGVSTLTCALKPTSVVLSELGAELKDFRADLIRILREAMEKVYGKDNAPFIVLGDNTIAYEIPSGKFLCHEDCQFHAPKDLEPVIAGHGEVGLFKKGKKEYVFTNYYDALERHITKTTGKKEKLYIPYLKQEEE